jgi:hypothetical protein
MKQFKYDDIDGLQSLVSSEFGAWSNEVEVTQAMVNQFADPDWRRLLAAHRP